MSPIITLLAAILGAIIAQSLAHFLSLKREREKDGKIVFQEYITPFLNQVLLYYETETHFRKGHDVEVVINRRDLIDKVESKISYGGPHTLKSLLEYKNSQTFFDGRGFSQDYCTYNLFFWYLDDSLKILENIRDMDEIYLSQIRLVQKKYAIWSILTELYGNEDAIEVIKYQWVWGEEFFDYWSIYKLKNLLNIDYYPKEPYQNLIQSIKKELLLNQDSDEYQYQIDILANPK